MIFFIKSIGWRYRFSRFLRRSQYAEAIALWQQYNQSGSVTGELLWAYYQLGLYRSVMNFAWDGYNVKGGVAMAVSLAACGKKELAEEVVTRLSDLPAIKKNYVNLADALAPYMPELALSVLRRVDNAPAPLLLSLLLKNDLNVEAENLLKTKCFDRRMSLKLADVYLLKSNLLSKNANDQLDYLNLFLKSYGLPLLTVKDISHPVSVCNLKGFEQPVKVDGPLISVLMTAYNVEDRVAAALQGLLAQSYQNLEIIVVNDASSDNTGTIVQDLARQDSRIKYICLPKNSGTFAAKTEGFKLAQGDFVTCHDSDDWSHPQRLELQVKPLLKNKSLVATTSNWVRVQDDGIFYARPVHPLSRLNPASPLFRRELVVKYAGLWDIVRTGADSEFHTRLKLVFGRNAVLRVKLPLTFGAHRPNSLMTASSTGHADSKISDVRLSYWEAWNEWHINQLKSGVKPFMPSTHRIYERQFIAPKEIEI